MWWWEKLTKKNTKTLICFVSNERLYLEKDKNDGKKIAKKYVKQVILIQSMLFS